MPDESEIAEALGVSITDVHRWVNAGKLSVTGQGFSLAEAEAVYAAEKICETVAKIETRVASAIHSVDQIEHALSVLPTYVRNDSKEFRPAEIAAIVVNLVLLLITAGAVFVAYLQLDRARVAIEAQTKALQVQSEFQLQTQLYDVLKTMSRSNLSTEELNSLAWVFQDLIATANRLSKETGEIKPISSQFAESARNNVCFALSDALCQEARPVFPFVLSKRFPVLMEMCFPDQVENRSAICVE